MIMNANASAVLISMAPAVQIRRILYATDFSDASRAALPLVSTIARQYGSQVYVVNIWSPLPYSMVTPETVSALEGREEREAQAQASELLATAELAGLQPTAIVQSGDPVEELNRIVSEQNIDLTVLSTHGRTGWKHLVMGSVAEELFRTLTCPVLTIGPCLSKWFSTQSQVKNILFPTDLSEESRSVFPYLVSVASEYRSDLTLMHVLPEETRTNPDARKLADPLRKEMEAIFSPQISPRSNANFVIEFGDPAKTILSYAQRQNVDLIGMGVRKALPISTHFRNTTAYRVVLGAECPVLTCRPAENLAHNEPQHLFSLSLCAGSHATE
jgi:nucleotide-binding universal stress UspA family protein